MMIAKTSPVGIDWYVQQLQKKIHDELLVKWGIADSSFECYGRCYRNKTDDGYKAEVFTGENGKNYKEVYWNNTLAAISFFGISNQVKRSVKSEADVHLVFFVDLVKLKPAIAHRADEEVRKDVLNIIGKYSFGFSLNGYDLWLENVLRDYPGTIRDKGLKFVDMHPTHCFKINMKLIFDQNKIC